MATEAIATSVPGSSADVRPYAPSWIDRAFDAIEALPGPAWLAWLVLVIPSVPLSNSSLWLSGLRPWGDLDPGQVFWGVTTVAIAAASHYLRAVAGSAFDSFLPALGNGVENPERARYELTTMPARPLLALTLFAFLVTPIYYVTDPVAAQVVGVTPVGLVPRIVSEGLTTAIVLAILYQAIRQLRRVDRLHAAATAVDPFRPAPLYAFSRLTAQVAIVLIVFNTVGLAVNPAALSSETLLTLYVPWLVGFFAVAVVIFILPLLGMHGRLAAERDRLQSAAGGRLRSLLGDLNEAIDARASDHVEALDRAISALRHEQEALARLPAWPWSAGTIRGFGSALLLPIGLFVVQRFLGDLLGG